MAESETASPKALFIKAASATAAYVLVMCAYFHFKRGELTLRRLANTVVFAVIAAIIAAIWQKRSKTEWSWFRMFLTIGAIAVVVIYLFLGTLQASWHFR